MLSNLFGYGMIPDVNATEDIIKVEKRSIIERWFTLPFKPFKKLKSHIYKRPAIYLFEDKMLIHPALENTLLNQLKVAEYKEWMR